MTELIRWIVENYGTISAVLAGLFSSYILIKKWGNHAINSIMLSNKFHNVFGTTPVETIHELHRKIREDFNILELRQQISERYTKIGIYITDLAGQCIWTNDYLNEIFGKDSRDMLGSGWLSGIHRKDRRHVHEEWVYSVKNGLNFSYEYTICNDKDRISIRARSIAVPVVDEHELKSLHSYVGYLVITEINNSPCDCEEEEIDGKAQKGSPEETQGEYSSPYQKE